MLKKIHWVGKTDNSTSLSAREKLKYHTSEVVKFYLNLDFSGTDKVIIRLIIEGFSGGSDGEESACHVETWVLSLGREDPLENRVATSSSILAWRIPWIEETRGLQSDMIEWLTLTDHQAIGDCWRFLFEIFSFSVKVSVEQTRSRMMCGLNSDLGNLVSWHLYQLLLFFYLLIDKVTYFFFF